jgi:hypothetical protein
MHPHRTSPPPAKRLNRCHCRHRNTITHLMHPHRTSPPPAKRLNRCHCRHRNTITIGFSTVLIVIISNNIIWPACSPTHSLTPAVTHPLANSICHSLTHHPTRPLHLSPTLPLTHAHSLCQPPTRSRSLPLTHPLAHSLCHPPHPLIQDSEGEDDLPPPEIPDDLPPPEIPDDHLPDDAATPDENGSNHDDNTKLKPSASSVSSVSNKPVKDTSVSLTMSGDRSNITSTNDAAAATPPPPHGGAFVPSSPQEVGSHDVPH